MNSNPYEVQYAVKNKVIGINACDHDEHCEGLVVSIPSISTLYVLTVLVSNLQGYCCTTTTSEELGYVREYKRGFEEDYSNYNIWVYSQAICMGYDTL